MQSMFLNRRLLLAALAVLLVGGAFYFQSSPAYTAAGKQPAPEAAAVERTRETVKLMDDLHKFYIVTITATYVRAQEVTPAATVARKVFAHMEKKGYGTGRLIDATGKPYREENVAKSDFEKRALEAIKGGKAYFDEVGTRDGKSVLRAATVVPVVMKECMNCHNHVKEGQVMGAIVYEMPIR